MQLYILYLMQHARTGTAATQPVQVVPMAVAQAVPNSLIPPRGSPTAGVVLASVVMQSSQASNNEAPATPINGASAQPTAVDLEVEGELEPARKRGSVEIERAAPITVTFLELTEGGMRQAWGRHEAGRQRQAGKPRAQPRPGQGRAATAHKGLRWAPAGGARAGPRPACSFLMYKN